MALREKPSIWRERERDTCLYNFDFEIKVSKGEARLWESAREGGRRDCKEPPAREGGGREARL